MEEINTSQETLQFHFGSWPRHGVDCLDLGREGGHARAVHDVTEVGDLLGCQDTFLAVDAKSSA